MVSFTSISSQIFLISVIAIGLSEAAPAAASVAVAPHINATSDVPFTLPPLITSRTKPASKPDFAFNINAESESIAINKKLYNEHDKNYTNITRRADSTVGGMTMDLPSNPPSITSVSPSSSVVIASSAQIANFKSYAAIASTAYCRSVVPLGIWSCKNCLKYFPDGKLIVTFSSLISDTNGFVLRSDAQKTIHLVFRGTNSIRSAITDMIFDKMNYPPVSGAKIHTGFYNSFKEVVGKYFPVVQAQLTAYPSYKVAVSGHSLGGAQALLAGMDLYQREKRLTSSNLSIYTVGCPRVGNPAFAYYVDSTGIPVSRSVNNRDIVPHVPPQTLDFLHPGVEAWNVAYSNVRICTSNIETDDCSNSITPFTSFDDHLTYYDLNEGLCL